MILDILFNDSVPVQYKHVQKTKVYMRTDDGSKQELVIHFYDSLYPQVTINMARIDYIQVTND